jgi:3-hydroxyisobutyrate dehydrogenase
MAKIKGDLDFGTLDFGLCMNAPQRIAWIGTGVMGAAMAGHLLNAGYRVVVHSRSKSKAQSLLDRDAEWASTPACAADGADIAISMVGYPSDVEAVHLGGSGTLAASKPPRLIIDMTTSRPSLAMRIAEISKAKGIASLDAPVSGGDIGAKNATLSIMVGGEKSTFDQAMPILSILGKNIVHQGGPGAGQHTKVVNQILIASNMMGVCEGILYAMKAGLDPTRVIESVGSGAAGSWAINNLGPRMIRRDFNPGFYVEHFIKDLEIALEEAGRMNLAMPGLALARQLYEAVRAQGHGRLGTQALLLALQKLNGA